MASPQVWAALRDHESMGKSWVQILALPLFAGLVKSSFEISSPLLRKVVPALPAVEGSDERRPERDLVNHEVQVLTTYQARIITTIPGVAVTSVITTAPASNNTGWLHSRRSERGKSSLPPSPHPGASASLPARQAVSVPMCAPPPRRPLVESPRCRRRPAETRADSLSARAPCRRLGAGAASGPYIKAAWRAGPGRVREPSWAQGQRCAPEVLEPLAMASSQQQPPYLHLAELTASQFLEIWKHFDADGQ